MGTLPWGRRQREAKIQRKYTYLSKCLLQPPPHEGRGAQLYADAKPRPFALPRSKAPSPLPACPILSGA